MDRSALATFSAHAGYVLANPLFDREERESRLELAGRLRELLACARRGESIAQPLQSILRDLSYPGRPPNTGTAHDASIAAWAAEDEASLRDALATFEGGAPPERRAAAFVARARESRELRQLRPRLALTFASLLNFALAPTALPIVGFRIFEQVERRLGHDRQSPFTAIDEQYRFHLDFVEALLEQLARAGLPAGDVLDAQSLIALAAAQEEFWLPDPPRPGNARVSSSGSGPRRRTDPYLAICAVYKNEAANLREWIEFHRLVGVERFFLYDNDSTDDHHDALAPYLSDGSVTLTGWPFEAGQMAAYDDCLRRHAGGARWIAFVDVDEFLFSPLADSLADVLTGYEAAPGIGVNWRTFGPCGHARRPDGLVIESYLTSVPTRFDRYIKSIVDPALAVRSVNSHHFDYRQGFAVDENRYPIVGAATTFPSSSILRLNHYYTKSFSEFEAKRRRGRADVAGARAAALDPETAGAAEKAYGRDERDIIRHLPALRSALASA
jgi:hypothetical protein